jgi:ubiquitin C-terminal hydrolase
MSDLRPFNTRRLPQPTGFRNIGFTCYYNSLIQSLMSCSSFVDLIAQPRDDKFLSALHNTIADPTTIPYSWSILMQSIVKKSPNNAYFTNGQQCAAELYTLLLDVIDQEEDIQELFTYRRQNEIFCPECKKIYSSVTETNNLFDLPLNNGNVKDQSSDVPCSTSSTSKNCNTVESFLLRHNSDVDANAVCTLCHSKGPKKKTSRLRLAPEILFINVKQYRCQKQCEKIYESIKFQEWMEFDSTKKLKYRAVAYIQHYGSIGGGHYTAVALRPDQNTTAWYHFDDQSVSAASFAPDDNTYCILYHYVE